MSLSHGRSTRGTPKQFRRACSIVRTRPPLPAPGQSPQGDRLGNEPTKESLKLHARGTADLTNRQGQVLGYLAMGLTANEIGERLRISTRTARAHMDVLKRKLGANRSRDLPIASRRASANRPPPW